MTATAQRLLKHAGLVVGGAGLLIFTAIILTPSLGTIVGYANTEPALEIVHLDNGAAEYNVDRVLRLMRSLFAQRPELEKEYWPLPQLIEEKADCWLVVFTAKVPVYSFLGFQHTVQPTTPAMYVSVSKADYTVRFGKWCR